MYCTLKLYFFFQNKTNMNFEFWVYLLPTEVSQAADFSHIQSSILQFDPRLFISICSYKQIGWVKEIKTECLPT